MGGKVGILGKASAGAERRREFAGSAGEDGEESLKPREVGRGKREIAMLALLLHCSAVCAVSALLPRSAVLRSA